MVDQMAVRHDSRAHRPEGKQGRENYTFVAVMLHWCIAVLVTGQIMLGLAMDRAGLPDTLAFSVFQTHRALGVVILLLVVWRVIWRFLHHPPALLLQTTAWQARLADTVHGLLYGFQLLAPLSGWALASCATLEMPLSMFGWFNWPLLPLTHSDDNETLFRSLHHAIVWSFAALILLHVMAAFYHLIRRDGVARRMMSLRSSP